VSTTTTINRRIVLASRPDGIPEPGHFRRDDQPLPQLQAGQLLVRNLYLSIDPAQRGWVNAGNNYSNPVAIGDVMRSLAVGVVEQSRNDNYRVGVHVYGWLGWQDYCVANADSIWLTVDPQNGPLTTALGVLGINGLTAFLALNEIGCPKPGETVVVSTAAGAVGSIVGQIARRDGCHVVGLTGSNAKAQRCVSDYGYQLALNYHDEQLSQRVKDACPRGVDVFFDNTSGSIADAVWPHLNSHARIVQCGTAAIANWLPPPVALRRDRDLLVKRLRHAGFVIFDHAAKFPETIATLGTWLREGTLKYRDDIEVGLDRAPHALAAIYRGENEGKKIIML
jgi:NADPH-dependent curcumin reductase